MASVKEKEEDVECSFLLSGTFIFFSGDLNIDQIGTGSFYYAHAAQCAIKSANYQDV